MGARYNAEKQITLHLVTQKNVNMIQSRAQKEEEAQLLRTREKAEVFTPSWVCNAMNNLVDKNWFGKEAVFNHEMEKSWETRTAKIVFPKNKSWKDYVCNVILEVACGEAPFLTSRYDTVTGDAIKVPDRIGFLDRKLRVISENTNSVESWLKWATRAFECIYAYEFQGDRLFIARNNLLITFVENMQYKFNLIPPCDEIKKVAKIISWNTWQMDGLTNAVPFSNCEFCKIKNWHTRQVVEFASLLGGLHGK
jgi:hypothetical protein